MKKVALAFVLLLVVGVSFNAPAIAQKKYKPWMEWNEKEVLKMLNESPWGQTQTETNTSEMFYRPTASGGTSSSRSGSSSSGGLTGTNDRGAEGALNQATNVHYRIRFLSAKPVRQAFARRVILQTPQAEAQLKAFAEQKSADYIVVAVDYESSDQRFNGKVMQTLNSANLGMLANTTYLETKDGKRLFLKDYKAPINDGMGAKFIFPRTVDGQPFVKEDSGYVRFYSEVFGTVKLNMRFKVQDMLYEGALEY